MRNDRDDVEALNDAELLEALADGFDVLDIHPTARPTTCSPRRAKP